MGHGQSAVGGAFPWHQAALMPKPNTTTPRRLRLASVPPASSTPGKRGERDEAAEPPGRLGPAPDQLLAFLSEARTNAAGHPKAESRLLATAARLLEARSAALLRRSEDGDYRGMQQVVTESSKLASPHPVSLAGTLVRELVLPSWRRMGPFVLLPAYAAPEMVAGSQVGAEPTAEENDLAVLALGPDAGRPTHVLVLELAAASMLRSGAEMTALLAAVIAARLDASLARPPRGPRATRPSAALVRERRLLQGLLEAGASVHEALTLDQVLQRVARILGNAGGFDAIAVYILEVATGLLHPRAIIGVDDQEAERMRATPLALADYLPLMQPEMRVSRSFLFDHRKHEMPPGSVLDEALSVPEMPRNWRPGQWHPMDSLTIPLDLGQGQTLGLISLDRPRNHRYPDLATIRALELFADQCATAISRAQLHSHMEQLASTDPLTGLHNRRALAETIVSDLARADRSGHPYSILFCDLDHFKEVNDHWGHAIGDQVLQQVAAVLRQRLRRGDFAARYGGDEFVVLLHDTTQAAAALVAEDLRQRVSAAATPRPVTISIGAAEAAPGAADWAELVEVADAAMYLAKKNGRNRVGTSTDLAAPPDPATHRLSPII